MSMVARSALSVVAMAAGAAAFMAPMPTPAVRLAAGMPVVGARARVVAGRSPLLRYAMLEDSNPELRSQKPGATQLKIAGKGDNSAFAKGVGKVVLVTLASTVFFGASAFAAVAAKSAVVAAPAALGWWSDAKFWGFLGAIAGWGMSLAAIKDAATGSPEIISENMTFVMIIYSTLFAWWAWIVNPQNMLLCACHTVNVFAQGNQMRRLLAYKSANGKGDEVAAMGGKAAMVAAGGVAAVVGGPALQSAIVAANGSRRNKPPACYDSPSWRLW